MQSTWQIPQPIKLPPALLNFTGDRLLAELLARRGLTGVAQARAFLDPAAYQPAPPESLPDMEQAVARLQQALARKERIWVWGDFDVDGQTSTTLLVSMLQALGHQARWYIPNRLTESHGIKRPALERVLAEGVDLLLTCDTGIDAHEQIALAQAAGVDVIVTDHHDLADTLPPARAVLNPKRLPAGHPLGELPGVGVAFKLAQALFQACDRAAESDRLLDLVALGIVADVARQTGDTRYLLQRGLEALQQTERTGLHALFESANLKAGRLTEDHIGFWLAPRLNALGRLGDANLAVELLTTTDLTRARIIALQLEGLNDRRKLLVDRVVVQALSQLADTPSLAEYNAIVLAAADWHPGVIGIAASRLAEQYHKPVVLIALRPDGLGRGSARSVAGCDIHQAIKSQAELLRSFGGHPMAAGLSVEPDQLTAFRRGLSGALAGCRPTARTAIELDLMVELSQISAPLLHAIQRLAPFGPGNPPVTLGSTGLTVLSEAIFGKTAAHRKVTVADEAGQRREVIWWGGASDALPQGKFDLAFTLSPDDYAGGDAVQVEWRAAREWEPAVVTVKPSLTDWRQLPDTEVRRQVQALPQAVIWAEGERLPNLAALPRHQLARAEQLVVWSAPPGGDVFQQVLALVRPQQIYLVGQPSPLDSLPPFIRQLMGLLKFAVSQREGEVNLRELAGALGHRPATARLGLDWLAAQGKVWLDASDDEFLVVRPVQQPPAPAAAALHDILKTTLSETAAYRRFFREASLTVIEKMMASAPIS